MKDLPVQKLVQGVWLAAALGIFFLFLRLSFFNVPQSDDFFYAMWMRDWGFADSNITIYYAWGGRYFSNIVLTLCNGLGYSTNYKDFLLPYQFHSVVHILLFLLSGRILFMRIPFIQGTWMVLIPLIFFIQKAASIQEFFYWLAGTATYCSGFAFGAIALATAIDIQKIRRTGGQIRASKNQIILYSLLLTTAGLLIVMAGPKTLIQFLNKEPMVSLFLFWLSNGLMLFSMNKKAEASLLTRLLCLVFCSLACAGSSELAGAVLLVSFGFLWLWHFSWKEIKNPSFHLPILFSVLALALNVLAPATANREGTISSQQIGHNLTALQGTLSIFSRIVETVPELLAGFFLALIFGSSSSVSRKMLGNYFLLFAGFQFVANGLLPFATLLKAGELPARAVNIHQLAMSLSVFVTAYAFGLWFRQVKPDFSPRLSLALNISLPLLLFVPVKKNNILDGLDDWRQGRAEGFYLEFCKEQESIKNCSGPVCEVEELRSKPKCISSMSNAVLQGFDPPAWIRYKDESYAAFYGKKHIFRKGNSLR